MAARVAGTLRRAGCDPVVFVGGEPAVLDPPRRRRRRRHWLPAKVRSAGSSRRSTCARTTPIAWSIVSCDLPFLTRSRCGRCSTARRSCGGWPGVDVVVGAIESTCNRCARSGDRARRPACERHSNAGCDRSSVCSTSSTPWRCRVSMPTVRNINTLDDLGSASLTPVAYGEITVGELAGARRRGPDRSTSASPMSGPTATFRGRSTCRSAPCPTARLVRRHADVRHLQVGWSQRSCLRVRRRPGTRHGQRGRRHARLGGRGLRHAERGDADGLTAPRGGRANGSTTVDRPAGGARRRSSTRCSRVDRYALDTEFHRERTYFPKLALIQVAWHDATRSAASRWRSIDPLTVDVRAFAPLFDVRRRSA